LYVIFSLSVFHSLICYTTGMVFQTKMLNTSSAIFFCNNYKLFEQCTVKPPYNMISGERWKITLYQVSCYTKVLPILYPYQWKTKVSSNIKHLIRKRNKRDDLRVRRWRLSIDNGQLSKGAFTNDVIFLRTICLFFSL